MRARAEVMWHPRQIYIDLGVNFGDTLDLFERLDNRREEDRRASAAAWEVFGFEAVPSTSTYLEELFRHKNGEGARPVWCFPPVGSTFDKMRFASMLGCERTWTPKMTSCMSTVFGQAERQMLREVKVSQSLLSFESVDASVFGHKRKHSGPHFRAIASAHSLSRNQ